MKIREFLMKALPYVVAVVVFWAVSAAYFAPQLGGKTLQMNDVQMYKGMKQDISLHREAFDEDPQWTGGMFGGMPAYLISVQYPAMIIRNAVQSGMNALGEPMALMFLAMLGFWLMMLMAGVNPWLAIPFALAYGLSTYNILIIEAGHITKMRAMGYAPMLLGAVFYTFRGNMWLGGALAALFGTLTVATSHHQITYYFLLVILVYWINTLIVTAKEKSWKRFWKASLVLLAAAVLAGGANFTHLWYTAQHAPDTTRGGSEIATTRADAQGLDLEYTTAWSYGIAESMNMFIPNFRGEGSSSAFRTDDLVGKVLRNNNINPLAAKELPMWGVSQYWGKQPFTGGPTYLGAVMVMLFLLGMIVLPARKKWWVLAVSVLAILLAWGGNCMWFTELAIKILPGYNKFRTVSMALVIVQLTVPFVAAMTVARVAERSVERRRMNIAIYIALGVTGLTALIFALFGGLMWDFAAAGDVEVADVEGLVEAIRAERLAEFRADCWRSLAFVILTAAVVWMYVNLQNIKQRMLVAAMAVLAVADLVPVGVRYLSHDDFKEPARIKIVPDFANNLILSDEELGFRVLNVKNTFNDGLTSYFHRSVGGYHGAKLARYQDIIDRYLSKPAVRNEMLNALNTKYIIHTSSRTGKRTAETRKEANGAAWFVDRVMFADGPHEELAALDTIDTKTQAVVDQRFADCVGYFFAASEEDTISLVEYRPNYLKYETSSDTEQVAVFSEIYYDKGWKAYIDGKPSDYFRADYILRAMVVPAGKHTVEWKFRAPRFALVEGVTLSASIAILVWLAMAIFVIAREKRWKTEE